MKESQRGVSTIEMSVIAGVAAIAVLAAFSLFRSNLLNLATVSDEQAEISFLDQGIQHYEVSNSSGSILYNTGTSSVSGTVVSSEKLQWDGEDYLYIPAGTSAWLSNEFDQKEFESVTLDVRMNDWTPQAAMTLAKFDDILLQINPNGDIIIDDITLKSHNNFSDGIRHVINIQSKDGQASLRIDGNEIDTTTNVPLFSYSSVSIGGETSVGSSDLEIYSAPSEGLIVSKPSGWSFTWTDGKYTPHIVNHSSVLLDGVDDALLWGEVDAKEMTVLMLVRTFNENIQPLWASKTTDSVTIDIVSGEPSVALSEDGRIEISSLSHQWVVVGFVVSDSGMTPVHSQTPLPTETLWNDLDFDMVSLADGSAFGTDGSNYGKVEFSETVSYGRALTESELNEAIALMLKR